MDIATLGVAIDPARAVSGARAASQAADAMGQSFRKADEANKQLNQGMTNAPARTDAFSRAMRAAKTAVDAMSIGLRNVAGVITTVGAAFNFLTGAMVAIRAIMLPLTATWNAFKGAISGAADFEDYTIQFAQLLGSFEKADDKLRELADIAAKTPFNLPEIVRGTVTLQSLSQGALTTRENLLMIGDAVAKSKQPFDEMTVTIGRLYANIKNGISSAFEVNRLVETGVITQHAVKIRQMMEKDNEAGKNAAQIWSLVEQNLRNASGSMILMSQTTNGLWSTLQDGWDAFQRTIGAALNEGIRPLLRSVTDEIEGWTKKAEELAPMIEQASIKAAAFIEVLRQNDGFKLSMLAAWEEIKAYASQIVNTLGDVLKNRFEIAAFAVTEQFNKMQTPEFWLGMATQLKQAATDFVDTITLGLSSAARDFKSEMSQFGSDIAKLGEGIVTLDMKKIDEALFGVPAPAPGSGGIIQNNNALALPAPPQAPDVLTFADAWKVNAVGESTELIELRRRIDEQEAVIKSQNATSRDNSLLAPQPTVTQSTAATEIDDSAKKAKKAADDMKRSAEQFIKATQTPMEVFQQTMAKITQLEKAGYLTADQAGRARVKAQEDYQKALKKTEDQLDRVGKLERSQFSQLMEAWGSLPVLIDQASVQIAHSISQNITNGLVAMLSGTKSAGEAFRDMAFAIVQELIRIMIQILVMKAISAAAGGYGGLIGGIVGAIMHTGGTVGEGGSSRVTTSSVFQNAPRFQHGGQVASGETPVIAEAGETVLTRQQSTDIKKRLGQPSQEKKATQISIVNVVDPAMVEQAVAKDHSIVLNVIAQNARTVKHMLG